MALTYLPLAILVFSNIIGGNDALNFSSGSTPAMAILDPKRRNDLVDEAFLEQKDILLDMLEAKLKEVRDKKKKKTEQMESSNADVKCDLQPNNVDLNLKANGIVAVGESDVNLKFGESGNSTLNLNSTGISNVGKAHLNLGIGDGTIYIPGLNNLFIGSSFVRNPCDKQNKFGKGNEKSKDKNEANLGDILFRRSMEISNSSVTENLNETSSTVAIITNESNNVTDEITTVALSEDSPDTEATYE